MERRTPEIKGPPRSRSSPGMQAVVMRKEFVSADTADAQKQITVGLEDRRSNAQRDYQYTK